MSEQIEAFKKFEAIIGEGYSPNGFDGQLTVTDVATYYEWDADQCEEHFAEFMCYQDIEHIYTVKQFLDGTTGEQAPLDGKLTFNELADVPENWDIEDSDQN